MMIRQDYSLIAASIKRCMEQAVEQSEVKLVAHALARDLRLANPAFKREKFLLACGIPENEQWPEVAGDLKK